MEPVELVVEIPGRQPGVQQEAPHPSSQSSPARALLRPLPSPYPGALLGEVPSAVGNPRATRFWALPRTSAVPVLPRLLAGIQTGRQAGQRALGSVNFTFASWIFLAPRADLYSRCLGPPSPSRPLGSAWLAVPWMLESYRTAGGAGGKGARGCWAGGLRGGPCLFTQAGGAHCPLTQHQLPSYSTQSLPDSRAA